MTNTKDSNAGALYVAASSRSFITQIALKDLSIDPEIQRAHIKESRVMRMASEFNPDGLGVLEVSQRLSGMNHVLDGGHRLSTLREVRKRGVIPEDYPVTCKVFVGLTSVEEALLFSLLNDKEKVGRYDLFRIKLKAQNPAAVDISRILAENGWKLSAGSSSSATGLFVAIASLEIAYARNPVAAEKAIRTLTRAWDHRASTVNGELVRGLGMFYNYYGDAADMKRAVDKLIAYPKKGIGFLSAAKSEKELIKGTTENAVALLMEKIYNVGKSTLALPPWPRNGKRDPKAPPVVNTLDKLPTEIVVEGNTVRIPALETQD